ncbi:hypothetical protein F2Q68_00015627 [Brassica cretica]|uniref:Uncharacterized protein n=1 Tax=Brassica cretica TaxID=69181 RepID=A0A8S9HFU8_BRACR|nr:hypothetical protein F2Q68_00015627 [Brassica cretica]
MPVLTKSGQSASQEEAVEEMKDCRSIKKHWCRSTMMPERGPSIFQDHLKPRSQTKYMPISTRSSKEELLFFSDQARLEHSIRREKRTSSIDTTSTTSIDTTSTTSIDTTSTTSIDTCDKLTIDSSTRTSIDTNPRADMVATLVPQRDENGDLHDPEGHLCSEAGQKIDGQGTAILEPSAATEDAKVPLQRTLTDLIRPCLFYTNRYMPISTRSSKDELLFFSDPARLERSIRKEKRTSSIDTTSTTSIDTTFTTSIDTTSTTLINTTSTTSIDTCDRATIDSSTRTSIDTNPRADMVATLVLQRDENGDLHDPGGQLCNAAGQRIDGQGTAILEPFVATEDAKVPLQRSLADLTRPNAHVMMLDAQVSQTAEAVKKQEALVKGKVVESERHQVNAISDDDFGEVLKQEKLEEDAFVVESCMSIGSSYWCQRTSTAELRSTSSAEHRSTPLLGLNKTVRIKSH